MLTVRPASHSFIHSSIHSSNHYWSYIFAQSGANLVATLSVCPSIRLLVGHISVQLASFVLRPGNDQWNGSGNHCNRFNRCINIYEWYFQRKLQNISVNNFVRLNKNNIYIVKVSLYRYNRSHAFTWLRGMGKQTFHIAIPFMFKVNSTIVYGLRPL